MASLKKASGTKLSKCACARVTKSPYQSPATIILITLSGSAEIHSSVDGSTTTLLPDRIISLAPLETHSIRATADNTHLIAIKSGPTT